MADAALGSYAAGRAHEAVAPAAVLVAKRTLPRRQRYLAGRAQSSTE